MYIMDSLLESYNNFEINAAAIDLHSGSRQDIMLPYGGDLPKQMSPASSAFIKVTARPTQGASLVLTVDVGGKKLRMPLDADDQEVIDLLDRFFEQSRKETGLSSCQFGFWNANYIEWRKIAAYPLRLLYIIEELSVKEQAYILSRWLGPLQEFLEVGAEYSEQFKAFRDWIISAPKEAIWGISGRKWLSDVS